MIFKSNNPYPKVQVEQPNLFYASILLDDYAGNLSEDTAIHLYLYQAFVDDEHYNQYKDIMLHIAEVEMTHLRLLGETIMKLGALPIFGVVGKDRVDRLWSASNVNYEIDLKQMLEIDIQAETNAIRNYEYQLNIIKDVYIQAMIKRILEDEKIHLSIFQNLYQNLVTY